MSAAQNVVFDKELAPAAPATRLRGTALVEWAVLGALVLAWAWFSYGYIEDDAFIHLEFARSVASGLGFAFGGTVTNGDTAPLWVLFITFFHFFGVEWVVGAKLACTAGLALSVSGAWRLARDLPRERPVHDLLPFFAVALTLLNPYFVHWSFSGMEATAALGLSMWVVWAVFLGTLTAPRALFGASLLAVGPLLRPELLVFAALVAPALLWRFWHAQGTRSPAFRLVWGAALGMVMLLPLCIWCGYALHAFGSLVPNTNMAKRGGAIGAIASRLIPVYLMGFPVTLLLLPFACAWGMWRRHTPAAVLALLLWPTACVAFYLANHTVVQTRYCLLSMPCMTIGVLWLLGRIAPPRLFAGAAAAMLLASVFVIVSIVIPHVRNKEQLREQFAAVSEFIRHNVPAREPVAVFAIGQLEFESRHPLVDLGGITQPQIVPYLNDSAAALRWAKARGARYFAGNSSPEAGAEPVFDVTVPYIGWTLQRALYRGTQSYSVYRLP
ncbi:MAG TPA: hypothetical protein VNY82_12105 [Steroidobacteraceae bacterium]|jgi:hypothetical protein|nr:hypothetical protein [Steroidobacteraceae bacterium]